MSTSEVSNFQLNKDALLIAPPTDTLKRAADYWCCDVEELITMMLNGPVDIPTWDGKDMPPKLKKWQPGVRFGDKVPGPSVHRKAKVVVVGKMPNRLFEEKPWGPPEPLGEFTIGGQYEELFRRMASELDWPQINDDWYITNVVRYVPFDGGKTLKPQHIADCKTLLAQELALLQPEVILVTGADAVKVICGKNGTLGAMRGNAFIMRGIRGLGSMPQPLYELDEVEAEYIPMKVVVTVNPGAVLREGGYLDGFRADLRLARDVSRKETQRSPTDMTGRDYTYTSDPEVLAQSFTN
jgi:uracil-DNA glycosylase family 4